MGLFLFAVEIDADWLKGLGVLMVGVIGAVSWAFVRMYRIAYTGRNAKRVTDNKTSNSAKTTDNRIEEAREQRRARRDSVLWDRIKGMMATWEVREKELIEKVDKLAQEVADYRADAVACKEREKSLINRDKERDQKEKELENRIRELETRMGASGSGEHTPLKD